MKGYYRKRGSKWAVTIELERDPMTGKRRQKQISGFKTKREAQKAAAELISKIENSQYFEPSNLTIKDFLTNWLEDHCKLKNSIQTYDSLKSKCKRIIPIIGHIKLKDLKPIHIQKFQAKLFEENLSPMTVATLHSVLNRALNYAVKMEFINVNPAPKIGKPHIPKKEQRIWNIEECNKFLEYTKEHSIYYIVYFLAIYTGMRRGEIVGLPWTNVDIDTKTIYVTQSLYYKNKNDYVLKEPKSASSKRKISIDIHTVKELRSYRAQTKLLFGERDLVCSCADGTPFNPNKVAEEMQKIIIKLNLPKIRFHDLRHTHATLLLKLGTNPKIIQERLGHENIQITLDTYSHVFPDMQQDCIANFSKAMNSDI